MVHANCDGVGGGLAGQSLVQFRGLGLKEGVIVESVNRGGPAESAGMKSEDVIVSLNGKNVKDGDDLVERVSGTPVGETVTVTVDRNGKRMDLKIVVADREEQRITAEGGRSQQREDAAPEKPEPTGAKFGLRIRPATETEREAAAIEKGVVVTTVDEGSFAEEVGLLERDILVSINRQAVGSIDEIRGIQGKLKPGDAVAFRVMRPSPFAGRQGGGSGRAQYVGTYLAGTLPTE